VSVSGTPSAAGTATFTVNVTNADGATLAQNYTLTVNPNWRATSEAVGSDGNTRLLWTKADGTAVIWNVNAATGQVSAGPDLGPYAGWTAAHLAAGADGCLRLLWDGANGQESLWSLDAAGNPLGAETFGPY
jgi:hypothetical protein